MTVAEVHVDARIVGRIKDQIVAAAGDLVAAIAPAIRDELLSRWQTTAAAGAGHVTDAERVRTRSRVGRAVKRNEKGQALRTREVRGKAGVDYEGKPLPLNAPSTVRGKAHRGRAYHGQIMSLYDTGLLWTPDAWRIRRVSPYEVHLLPPLGRVRVVGEYLPEAGYRAWGVPALIRGMQPSAYIRLVWGRILERRLGGLGHG